MFFAFLLFLNLANEAARSSGDAEAAYGFSWRSDEFSLLTYFSYFREIWENDTNSISCPRTLRLSKFFPRKHIKFLRNFTNTISTHEVGPSAEQGLGSPMISQCSKSEGETIFSNFEIIPTSTEKVYPSDKNYFNTKQNDNTIQLYSQNNYRFLSKDNSQTFISQLLGKSTRWITIWFITVFTKKISRYQTLSKSFEKYYKSTTHENTSYNRHNLGQAGKPMIHYGLTQSPSKKTKFT